jgi:hypothetical protein
MLIEIAHQKTWLPIPNPMFFGVFDNMVRQDTMVLLHLPRIYIFRTDFYLFRRNRKSISICWQGTAPFFSHNAPGNQVWDAIACISSGLQNPTRFQGAFIRHPFCQLVLFRTPLPTDATRQRQALTHTYLFNQIWKNENCRKTEEKRETCKESGPMWSDRGTRSKITSIAFTGKKIDVSG